MILLRLGYMCNHKYWKIDSALQLKVKAISDSIWANLTGAYSNDVQHVQVPRNWEAPRILKTASCIAQNVNGKSALQVKTWSIALTGSFFIWSSQNFLWKEEVKQDSVRAALVYIHNHLEGQKESEQEAARLRWRGDCNLGYLLPCSKKISPALCVGCL